MRKWLYTLVVAALGGVGQAATYTVVNTNNSGAGSYRQALIDLNATGHSSTNIIQFNIPDALPHTIRPESLLPFITRPVLIDGYSEPDYTSGFPVVDLDGGPTQPLSGIGMFVSAPNCTIRGLVVCSFNFRGIQIVSNACTVEGCWIISNKSDGVHIQSAFNTIGGAQRNIISGQTGNGIKLDGAAASYNRIYNNYIGLDATGLIPASNNSSGVFISDGSHNIIGSLVPSKRNVIGQNGADGVVIVGASGSCSPPGQKSARRTRFRCRGGVSRDILARPDASPLRHFERRKPI